MRDEVDVRASREGAGLTQAEAAQAARISVATWRRAEDDLSMVSAKTRAAVERVLKTVKRKPQEKSPEAVKPAEHVRRLNMCFGTAGSSLTPATAAQLLVSSDQLVDLDAPDWAEQPAILDELPDAVRFRVHDNHAWYEMLADTFKDVAKRISAGVRPYPRTLAEEYVLHTALGEGKETWDDMPPWEYLEGLERRDNDGDWGGVAAELSRFPFGFPELTEDEIADHTGEDGRVRLSRLHPYRWWEPLDLALEEWRTAGRPGTVSQEFVARTLFDFIRNNLDIVDEIFEADLYGVDLDAARKTVLLRDATGFTAVFTVAHPDAVIPPRDNPFQAFVYASALIEYLFRTREEQRMAECGACGECEECDLGLSTTDDVAGRDSWRRLTGLNLSPTLIDVGDSENDFQGGNQAVGIRFNDSVVIRVTIAHVD
ncbi:helix-turn-helix transcriptional regulator [Actinomadura sp. KC06]|uniref:helix-turn-helix domain-containing protein n=1 Tax=Actinomadura sp. KC06 TaxID=2530369 RepID=UPI001404E8FE|nr:helix-turn-helix transcriptional regulator [Actinomadura sp. KC06]